jgi:hypothetical protein
MTTALKQTTTKVGCSKCKDEYTKKTLDKYGGQCKLCFDKSTSFELFPKTNPPTQFEIPADMLKLSKIAFDESKIKINMAPKKLSERIDNWISSKYKIGDEKNNAAIEVISILVKDNIKSLEKIKNINLLNIEKLLNNSYKALVD